MGETTGRLVRRGIRGAMVVGLVAVSGCANMHVIRQTVRDNAVRDLNCPPEQLEVTEMTVQTYRARGCQKSETYVVGGECTELSNCYVSIDPPVVAGEDLMDTGRSLP